VQPAPYVPRRGNAPLFICWFGRYINCVCLLHFLDFFLSYLFFLYAFFYTYLLPLFVYFLTRLSTSSRISLFSFQAGGRRRWRNLALIFLGSFYILLYILSWYMFCCCVCFSFSVLCQAIGWEEHLWNDVFCVGWDVKPESEMCSVSSLSPLSLWYEWRVLL